MRKRPKIAPHKLREIYSYNETTGELTYYRAWKRDPRNYPAGRPAGAVNNNGYLVVQLKGKSVSATAVIWAMMTGKWPEQDIDHKDRNPLNNRFANLREVSRQVNAQNRYSKRGGAVPNKDGTFAAVIGHNSKVVSLGTFPTEAEARGAYAEAKARLHKAGPHGALEENT